MPATYTLIEKQTLPDSTAGKISFLSIPQTYKDLALWVAARNDDNGFGGFSMYFNNSNSNLQYGTMNGEANPWTAVARNDSIDIGTFPILNDTPADVLTPCEIYILNYASSQKKEFRVDSGRLGSYFKTRQSWGFWNSTSPITRIDFDIDPDDFKQGSVFLLYGISNI